MNHDKHYKAETGLPEPIEIIEAIETRLWSLELDPNEVGNIARGLKYLLRLGLKESENPRKELDKFYNYMHRAKTGEWLGDKKQESISSIDWSKAPNFANFHSYTKDGRGFFTEYSPISEGGYGYFQASEINLPLPEPEYEFSRETLDKMVEERPKK